jgi:outer membrane lipoprotein LolB
MSRRLAAAALAAFALQGCATLPLGSDGLVYDDRRARLEAVDSWESSGRLAVDTGERGFQGSFRWQQAGDQLELTVRGPLRNTVLQVSGTPRDLTVTARGDTRVLADPETELSALLGWWLPVGSLHAWLLGIPDAAFPARTDRGPEGTLAWLEQRLWRVDYPAFQLGAMPALPSVAPAGVLIPRRIDLAHGELRVRLTVDDWQVLSP